MEMTYEEFEKNYKKHDSLKEVKHYMKYYIKLYENEKYNPELKEYFIEKRYKYFDNMLGEIRSTSLSSIIVTYSLYFNVDEIEYDVMEIKNDCLKFEPSH